MDYDPAPAPFPEDVFPEDAAQAYAHAWNPDPALTTQGPTGKAPHYANKYMKEAESKRGKNSYKYLAYGMHLIQDLGNPLHTGAWFHGTVINREIHRTYEEKVNERFDQLFKDHLKSLENLYVVNSPWYILTPKYKLHAQRIAKRTHDYAPDISVAVQEHLNDNPIDHVEEQTKQSLTWAEMYSAGLAAELTGYT